MSTVAFELLTPDDGLPLALVRLDDGKANALNPATLAALLVALDQAEQSEARALVITGRAGVFCGGLDLKVLPKLSTAEKRMVLAQLGEILLRIFAFRAPTVAAVSGHAIAGGALLALSADVRLGADLPARFGVTEVALGLPVPSFGLLLARAALAPPTLVEVALHGRVLSLREAQDRGVLRALFPEAELVTAAATLAGELARVDGAAYAMTKRALWAEDVRRIKAGMTDEVAEFIQLFEGRFPVI